VSYTDGAYDELIGRKVFRGVAYGQDGTFIKLDDKVYFLFEDEDDGYRSHGIMQGEAKPGLYSGLTFNLEDRPIEVVVEYASGEFTGILVFGAPDIVGKREKPMCRLGTDNCDDYYPMYISTYDSKEATEVIWLQDNYIAEQILLDRYGK
jgi:hypothetical protein